MVVCLTLFTDKLLVGLCENDRVTEAQKLLGFMLHWDSDVSFSIAIAEF
jgi:hypothetical protein